MQHWGMCMTHRIPTINFSATSEPRKVSNSMPMYDSLSEIIPNTAKSTTWRRYGSNHSSHIGYGTVIGMAAMVLRHIIVNRKAAVNRSTCQNGHERRSTYIGLMQYAGVNWILETSQDYRRQKISKMNMFSFFCSFCPVSKCGTQQNCLVWNILRTTENCLDLWPIQFTPPTRSR